MLISRIVLAVGQLAAASLPILGADLSGSGAAHVVPGEPSTLIEAAIGVALIAAYFLLVRRVRPRRPLTTVSKPTRRGTKRKAA